MKYHIGFFNIPKSQLKGKLKGKTVREYYISRGSDIVAGDFRSYQAAKSYLSTELLKKK